jgi:hypothetical protein
LAVVEIVIEAGESAFDRVRIGAYRRLALGLCLRLGICLGLRLRRSGIRTRAVTRTEAHDNFPHFR